VTGDPTGIRCDYVVHLARSQWVKGPSPQGVKDHLTKLCDIGPLLARLSLLIAPGIVVTVQWLRKLVNAADVSPATDR
jgi:hypothetical protein